MTLPDDIQKAFDSFAKTIIDMKEEITGLEKKFGTSSDLTAKKRRQLQSMIDFYKHMGEIVPLMLIGMQRAAVNQEMLMIMENKHALGVTWDRARDLLGLPETMVKDLATVDQIFERIMLTAQG